MYETTTSSFATESVSLYISIPYLNVMKNVSCYRQQKEESSLLFTLDLIILLSQS